MQNMIKSATWTLLLAALWAPEDARAQSRTFTVFNACPFTIWPAMFTDLTQGTAVPDFATGWEAAPMTSVSFSVPSNWKAGRIWGRRDCNFNVTTGPTCLTGWCNGGLLCDPHTGTGVPPATVAEWTLQGDGNQDFYDVSVVDGYDLPMSITTNVNCAVASCPVDLGPICPLEIQGPYDSTGFPVGCKSACFANLDGDPTNSKNCCSGSFDTAATCPSSGVEFYGFFKDNCPDSYAYAFDESSNTALWTCDSGLNADYTLTFCPSNTTVQVPTLSSNAASSPPATSAAIAGATSSVSVAGASVLDAPSSSAAVPGSPASSNGASANTPSPSVPDSRSPTLPSGVGSTASVAPTGGVNAPSSARGLGRGRLSVAWGLGITSVVAWVV